MTPRALVELITPARAQEFLDSMGSNRNLRDRKLLRYAADMSNDRWLLTGDPIKIDVNGCMIDGEHRCRAVILSGKTIESFVAYGISPSARVAMDTGTARSLADHLKMSGEINYSTLAATLTVHFSRGRGHYMRQNSPTHQEAMEILAEHPGMRDSAAYAGGTLRRLHAPRGLCGALHYETMQINKEDAEDFWSKLASGLDLHEKSSILLLRNRLQENAVSRAKLPYGMISALITKAWNHYREGREATHLRWRSGGANPEPFPQLQ